MTEKEKDYVDVEDVADDETEEGVDDETEEGSGEEDGVEAEAAEDTGEDDEDREAIRARRREERHDKKQAQRDREEARRREVSSLRSEKDELSQRLAVLERRSVGAEFAQLDQAIDQTQRATQFFKEQIRIASEAGDGATVAEATEKFWDAKKHAEHLNNIKRQAGQSARQQETHSPIDPVLRRNAEEWIGKHTWYDPDSGDADSRVALTIDNAMAEEGWDPRNTEYWDELDNRLKRYLPNRYSTTRERSKSPVASSGREGGGSTTGTFKLSPARVAAIKDSGNWDDPTARDKMIKNYRAYDKANNV